MLSVAHTSLLYFRLSENWIHTQIKHARDCDPFVLTNDIQNLDSVDWKPPVFSRRDELPHGILEADSLAMWMIGYYPSFYKKMKKQGIDLIHAHFGPMGHLCTGLARRLNVPLITTFYGYDASQLPQQEPQWRKKYQKLFNRGSRFLVEGPAMAKKLISLGCPEDKIVVQHLGVEVENYQARSHYRKDKVLKLLMVGRFVEKKGFIYGLKAFHKFLDDGGQGHLTIVGDSSDTPKSKATKQKLIQFVEENDLNQSVDFTGMIPLEDLGQEYYKHDLFLAPSVTAEDGDNEGGAPVTIIEASATGMPVVGSRHCDIPEVVQHNKTGYLGDEKDVAALTKYLFELFHHPEKREQMGRAAAEYIQEEFNAKKQGEKLTEIYKCCIGEIT